MRVVELPGGHAVLGDSTTREAFELALALARGHVPLVIADPPYGNVLSDAWDRWDGNDIHMAHWMCQWTHLWRDALLPNAAFYVWGGIGQPDFRPFFRYLVDVERPDFKLANLITWKKRRAYGVQHNYLFTREECAYLINGPDIKRPRCFNVPLLGEKRGYAGYDPKHPAKSEFYRRSNVWTDVTEVMRGKVHTAQKPERVMEVPVEVHTREGECVIDLFAGSGSTARAAVRLNRRYVVFEKDPSTFESLIEQLSVNEQAQSLQSTNEKRHCDSQEATRPSQAKRTGRRRGRSPHGTAGDQRQHSSLR